VSKTKPQRANHLSSLQEAIVHKLLCANGVGLLSFSGRHGQRFNARCKGSKKQHTLPPQHFSSMQQEVQPQPVPTPLEGEALEEAVCQHIEQLFSRERLLNEPFLISQMTAEMFVPITAVAALCPFTSDTTIIAQALRKSNTLTVNDTGTLVKPNFKVARNTLILRDIPTTTDPEVCRIPSPHRSLTFQQKVKEIFKHDSCPSFNSVWGDVGDCWFVSFASEEDAMKALEFVRTRTFEGAPVKARIKSENVLRSLCVLLLFSPFARGVTRRETDIMQAMEGDCPTPLPKGLPRWG
jgi:hypothetical protein